MMKASVLLLPVGLALAGCAEILDIPDDPAVVGPWRCLAEAPDPPPPRATEALVQVRACDFVDNCTSAVPNLTARLCQKRDPDCTNPIEREIHDVDGLLSFQVSTILPGFNGYLEVTSSTDYCTNSATFGEFGGMLCQLAPGCNPEVPDDNCRVPIYARAMFFFNPAILNAPPEPFQLPLIPAALIPTLLQGAGAELNPMTGNLFITAVDCDGRPAAGVTYTIEKPLGVTQVYLHNGLPNIANIETDQTGVGGFLGVPEGIVQVSGLNANGETVGAIGVHSRPFTMTYSALPPLATPL